MQTTSQSQGDTQPVSQWVYEQFSTNTRQPRATNVGFGQIEQNDQSKRDTLRSIQPGETGHVDLLGVFQEHECNPGALSLEQDKDDADPLSQDIDIGTEIFLTPGQFQQPKTPARQGLKRKRGESESQDVETPRLPKNPFAGQLGISDCLMDPSQLFKATQALTSPLIITSDGLSERPSPDIYNMQRPSTADSLSSPVQMTRGGIVRAVTEPQTIYVSMQASQEAREKQLQAQQAGRPLSPDELSDDDFGTVDTQVRRILNQKKVENEARAQFAGLTARSQFSRRGRGKSRGGRVKNTPDRLSSRGNGREASEPVFISDDGPDEEDQGNITEEETEREEEIEIDKEAEADELGDENKENVEVPRTISRPHHAVSQVIASQQSPLRRIDRRRRDGLQMRSMSPCSSSPAFIRSQDGPRSESWAQPDAIADSQPSQPHSKRAVRKSDLRASSEPRSSLENRILVPQSQSSNSSRVVGMTIPTIEPPSAPVSYRDLPNTSPHSNTSQQLVIANIAMDRQGNIGEESAATKTFRAEGSRERGSENESADYDQPPSPSSDRDKKKFEITERSECYISPPQHTDSNASISTMHHHCKEGCPAIPPNSMPSPERTAKTRSEVHSDHPLAEQSHHSTLFETAQEGLPDTPSMTRSRRTQDEAKEGQASPLIFRRSRTITEIAADPSPLDQLGDVDVDFAILDNEEDAEFRRTIHGSATDPPNRQKRKRARGSAVPVTLLDSNVLPPLPRTPRAPSSSAISWITPVRLSSDIKDQSPMTRAQASRFNRGPTTPQTSEAIIMEEMPPALKTVPISALSPSSQTKAIRNTRSAISEIPVTSVRPPGDGGHARNVERAEQTDRRETHQALLPVPQRVFAHFNGAISGYYPATCLRVDEGDNPRYTVRFDDGSVDTISAYGVKQLDLRVGDVIKVDRPGARTTHFIVQGMQDQHQSVNPPNSSTTSRCGRSSLTNNTSFPATDIHGFANVLVVPKQRSSLDGNTVNDEQLVVPLAQIYLTQTLWAAFRNRPYPNLSNQILISNGVQTPLQIPSTPSTPSSRTRRGKISAPSIPRSMATSTDPRDGLFTNMGFAITNVDRAQDSERIRHHITSNGGTIFEKGFDELFHVPPLQQTTSPKDANESAIQLTAAAKKLGFTCLIADKHCRRAKFIQALALGIPCLATRWVSDCVAKQRLVPWEPYLLPAGDSAYLGGVTRSRILPSFPVTTATLPTIIESRPKLLDDASILLIMEKGQEETMKQHPLISHALGARRVARAISQEAAAKAVSDAIALEEPWDWVFSYDKEEQVEKRLLGTGQTGKKRKRRRESEAAESSAKRAKGGLRVVGNEFVIQSLILGMLIED